MAVYGNRHIDDTLIELYDSLNNRGFFCLAAIEAVAEHSLMHQFAAGRPDTKDKNELINVSTNQTGIKRRPQLFKTSYSR